MKKYVLFPVPEELAEDVQRFLIETDMRATAARQSTNTTAETVVRVIQDFDRRCRDALAACSDASLAEKHLTIGELARNLHWTEYEAAGIVHELNELVWIAFGPKIAVVKLGAPKTEAIDWNERQIVIWRDLAAAVVAAEQQLAEGA